MPSDILTRPAPPVPRLLLSTRETAECLGVSVGYVRELVRAGQLHPLRLPATRGRPRSLRFPVEDVRAWITRVQEQG
jgi:excisionase family DNA binding protein